MLSVVNDELKRRFLWVLQRRKILYETWAAGGSGFVLTCWSDGNSPQDVLPVTLHGCVVVEVSGFRSQQGAIIEPRVVERVQP